MHRFVRRLAVLPLAVLGLVALAAPAQASHSIDYTINNTDTFETRQTSFGTTDVAWRVVSGQQDACFAAHTTKTSDSVQKRYHFYLTSHTDVIAADSPLYYLNYGERAQWNPGTPWYTLSTYHMKIKVVVSTNGGGYIDTITMQPESAIGGKQHFEYEPYTFNWPC